MALAIVFLYSTIGSFQEKQKIRRSVRKKKMLNFSINCDTSTILLKKCSLCASMSSNRRRSDSIAKRFFFLVESWLDKRLMLYFFLNKKKGYDINFKAHLAEIILFFLACT
jgi:hypothetical protein